MSCADGIGDVNGDGIEDMAVGGTSDEAGAVPGRVIILSGDSSVLVSVSDHPERPQEFSISTYPNPFNSTLSISLTVPPHQETMIALYDLLGREVDVIYRGRLTNSTISYRAPVGLASGIYFVRAEAGGRAEMRKVVLLK
ncbi:MAG: T9SS type A sorting domain-containing protein [bacterium]|nr:T9SS type A sorting domain-containing protein [bacterium]